MLIVSFSRFINKTTEFISRYSIWLTTALVLLICYDVAMRYIFGSTSIWIGELEWHIFSLIFLIAAGYAFKHERHVRIDLFYDKWSSHSKALIDIIGTVIFLIPWCLVIIYNSFNYALSSYQVLESSPDPAGLPARYVIKFAITIGFLLLLLQGLAFLIERINIIRSPNDDLSSMNSVSQQSNRN